MKKGKSGEAVEFTTREKSLKKLQLSLDEFRRLCILKGIYPRDPKHKNKIKHSPGPDNIFYHLKDMRFIKHEPLLAKFRTIKAFEKKARRLDGRKEWSRLENFKFPKYSLDHLIKERYPRFIDALRDLDDALTLVSMFSLLPLTKENSHQEQMVSRCTHLLTEFKGYLELTGSLTKSFISVKGIYYQAEIMGQPIVWIESHQFTSVIPSDVDIKIMLIFLEFYLTMLGFVNFKLYQKIGIENEKRETRNEMEVEGEKDSMADMNTDMQDDLVIARKSVQIFKNFTFFLGREVPFAPLNMIIKSLGGMIMTDMEDESNPSITHQIVDRPSISNMYLDRIYLQPQWIFDCLNAGAILPIDGYRIGEELPPHLCPFQSESPITNEEENQLIEEMILPPKNEEEELKREKKEAAVSMLSKRKQKLYTSMQTVRRKKASKLYQLKVKRGEEKAKSNKAKVESTSA